MPASISSRRPASRRSSIAQRRRARPARPRTPSHTEMITIEPARRRRAGRGKLGIALAGGGPLGAFYEIGALHALEEAIVGRALTDFDVYVGVSSGSVVAGALANGIDTTAMGSIFIHDTATILPLDPEILLHPAVDEYARRIALLPEILREIGRAHV